MPSVSLLASKARTELHAQHLLAGGGVQEAALCLACEVHSVRLEVLAQQLTHPRRRWWQRRVCCTLLHCAAICANG